MEQNLLTLYFFFYEKKGSNIIEKDKNMMYICLREYERSVSVDVSLVPCLSIFY